MAQIAFKSNLTEDQGVQLLARIKESFLTLQNVPHDDIDLDHEGMPQPEPSIKMGKYALKNSPDLCYFLIKDALKSIDVIEDYDTFVGASSFSPSRPREPKKSDYEPRTRDKIILIKAAKKYLDDLKKFKIKNDEFSEEKERIRHLNRYRKNLEGYIDFVYDQLSLVLPVPTKMFFEKNYWYEISEFSRRRHTFITGGTGSGKSNTLKHLMRHYITTNTDNCMIVLDPHGEISEDIIRFPEFLENDRLVYINPALDPAYRTGINFFDSADKSEYGLSTQSQQMISAFSLVINEFTSLMQLLLTHCLPLMLHRDETSFKDLIRLMDDNQNADLVQYAIQNLPYEINRSFFKYDFVGSKFELTKSPLSARFSGFIADPKINSFTSGQTTFNLEELIEQKKVIVFNLSVSESSREFTALIGQLLTAMIQGYSMRRATDPNNPKTPIHLFADEAQYFVAPSTEIILGEARKFNLHLTMATQRTKQVGAGVLDAIMGNVQTLITGKNDGQTLSVMSKALGVKPEKIQSLGTGEFIVSNIKYPVVTSQVPSVSRNEYSMSDRELSQLLEDQKKRYYHSVNKKPIKDEDYSPARPTRKKAYNALHPSKRDMQMDETTPKWQTINEDD